MVAFHTIPFETYYIDHREEVSGCWPPRLVCGFWRDFRRIDHWCDGRAQIQSCCHVSQDRVRCDVEASRLVYMSTCRIHHSNRSWMMHLALACCSCLKSMLTQSWLAPPDSFMGVLPWHGWDNAWLASCIKIGRSASPSPSKPHLDPIVVRLWQGELWTLPGIQLCHNATPSQMITGGASTVNAKWFQCPAW